MRLCVQELPTWNWTDGCRYVGSVAVWTNNHLWLKFAHLFADLFERESPWLRNLYSEYWCLKFLQPAEAEEEWRVHWMGHALVALFLIIGFLYQQQSEFLFLVYLKSSSIPNYWRDKSLRRDWKPVAPSTRIIHFGLRRNDVFVKRAGRRESAVSSWVTEAIVNEECTSLTTQIFFRFRRSTSAKKTCPGAYEDIECES